MRKKKIYNNRSSRDYRKQISTYPIKKTSDRPIKNTQTCLTSQSIKKTFNNNINRQIGNNRFKKYNLNSDSEKKKCSTNNCNNNFMGNDSCAEVVNIIESIEINDCDDLAIKKSLLNMLYNTDSCSLDYNINKYLPINDVSQFIVDDVNNDNNSESLIENINEIDQIIIFLKNSISKIHTDKEKVSIFCKRLIKNYVNLVSQTKSLMGNSVELLKRYNHLKEQYDKANISLNGIISSPSLFTVPEKC